MGENRLNAKHNNRESDRFSSFISTLIIVIIVVVELKKEMKDDRSTSNQRFRMRKNWMSIFIVVILPWSNVPVAAAKDTILVQRLYRLPEDSAGGEDQNDDKVKVPTI